MKQRSYSGAPFSRTDFPYQPFNGRGAVKTLSAVDKHQCLDLNRACFGESHSHLTSGRAGIEIEDEIFRFANDADGLRASDANVVSENVELLNLLRMSLNRNRSPRESGRERERGK